MLVKKVLALACAISLTRDIKAGRNEFRRHGISNNSPFWQLKEALENDQALPPRMLPLSENLSVSERPVSAFDPQRYEKGSDGQKENNFCTDGSKMKGHLACDGTFHCKDLSDEYLCPVQSANEIDNLYDIFEDIIKEKYSNFMTESESSSDELDNSLKQFLSKSKETRIENAMSFSHRSCLKALNRSVQEKNGTVIFPCQYCEDGEILCPISSSFPLIRPYGGSFQTCVTKTQVCDGVRQCAGGQDELFCKIERGKGKKGTNTPEPGISRNGSHFWNGRVNLLLQKKKRRKQKNNGTITCHALETAMTIVQKNIKYSNGGKFNLAQISEFLPRPVETRPPPKRHSLLKLDSRSKFFSNLVKQITLFKNSTSKSITSEQNCDGTIDCVSNADEMMCPGRFYCDSGTPLYVDASLKMNGVADCDDGSDEWEHDRQRFTLASKDKMIKDWPILFAMWLVGIIATLGNLVVIVRTILQLLKLRKKRPFAKLSSYFSSLNTVIDRCNKNRSSSNLDVNETKRREKRGRTLRASGRNRAIKLWNGVLVLNLASADFLMGVYLIVLASISVILSKSYWNYDKTWRTSRLCNALGVIVSVSSQTSVYTLVALTTLRLYTVIKPFRNTILRKTQYLFAICLATWIVSISAAVFPIIPGANYYYATEAWVPFPHMRPPVINQTQASNLVIAMVDVSKNVSVSSMQAGTSLTWASMLELTKQAAPVYSDWKFFGFYSTHSVCIPKLYATIGDVAWQHTAALLFVDFIAVVYICVAYACIYILSTKTRKLVIEKSPVCMTAKRYPQKSPSSSIESLQKSENNTPSAFCIKLCRKNKSEFGDVCSAPPTENSKVMSSKKSDGYSKIQYRIALLVATDCLCWIPICVMGFFHLAGRKIPYTAYTVSAVGLLPVNSALNPILYSNFLHEIAKRFYKFMFDKCVKK